MTSARMMAAAHNEFLKAQFASLPSLPSIEKLSESVWRILGGNPGKFQLQGTNTYLLGTGRERLLIDTAQGVPVWIESLKSVLESENAVISRALITHHHHDHVGGIADLLALSPSTVVHKCTPPGDPVGAGITMDIRDGETFAVEGATLTAHFTPGHTHDHMSFFLAQENALFTGDNVLGHGTSVFADLGAYIASLRKMLELRPGRAYPAHGQLVEDGQAKLREYITHRQRREDQVVQNLRKVAEDRRGGGGGGGGGGGDDAAAVTSMELVKRIYVDVDAGLHLAAEGGVVQVLEKLEKEGMAGSATHGGEKKWFIRDGKLSL